MADDKIKVWKVHIFDDSIIFNSLDNLFTFLKDDLENIKEPEYIIISPIWMTEKELDNLTEFEGH